MKYLPLLLLLAASPLAARCLVPEGYAGRVSQSAQRVVVLHRAPHDKAPGYEEMLIRILPRFEGADANPAGMVWVISLPNKALRYEQAGEDALEAGPAMRERLFQLARKQWNERTQFQVPSWLDGEPRKNIETHLSFDTQGLAKVGPYDITPIRARGAEGVKALNEYLESHGFPKQDAGVMKYFIDNDFSFLCVRVTPPAGQTSLGRKLDLPPLLVGFESDRPYYPAIYSADQGNFALDLTVISDKPLETNGVVDVRKRTKAKGFGYVQLVNLYSLKPLPDALAKAFSERATKTDKQRWYANRMESAGFNPAGDEGIGAWHEDVFFKIGGIDDELPGFWYYGDQDISFFERMIRQHAMFFFVGMGVLFFVSLFIKVRINRKRYLAEKKAA